MKRLFLTGGTGLLGKAFLELLPSDEFEVTIGSRKKSPNLSYHWTSFDLDGDNATLDLKGYDVVVHLASNTRNLNADSDLNGIETLLQAVKGGQVPHLIYISIVGVDTVPVKYFKTKKKVEELIKASGVSYSILRSTQFFEFFEAEIQDKLKQRVAIVPNLLYQPIETPLVAAQLVAMCQQAPSQSTKEIGGAEVVPFKKALKDIQALTKNKTWIMGIPTVFLGKLGKALTTTQQLKQSRSWADYLKDYTKN